MLNRQLTMRIQEVIVMISPLTRQSFLFSSNTVFILSIQRASTGLQQGIRQERV